jgi:DNA-directed RNA polymerase subunit RPC12/RpoP
MGQGCLVILAILLILGAISQMSPQAVGIAIVLLIAWILISSFIKKSNKEYPIPKNVTPESNIEETEKEKLRGQLLNGFVTLYNKKLAEEITMPKLMDCPDCGKQVSRRAASCPNCGCPITEIIKPQPSTVQTVSTKTTMLKCPTCGSVNIEKISTAKKAAYVAGVGILAPAFKKVRSQFECKNCRYKW